MDNTVQRDENTVSEQNGQQKIAVPYISPPPPDDSLRGKFKSPVMNGILIFIVILLVGFMTYNFVGHTLTRTASISDVKVTQVPVITPTVTPTPTPSY